MRTESDDVAFVKHYDKVAVFYACRSLGYDDRRKSFFKTQMSKCLAKFCVGGKVESGRGVVEYENVGIAHKCARNGKTLTLTARKVFAALRYLRVKPVFQRVDELCRLRGFQRVFDVVVGCVFVCPKQIVFYAAFEQNRFCGATPNISRSCLLV